MEATEDTVDRRAANAASAPVTPYYLERRWNAVKGRFADLRQEESTGAHGHLLFYMEQQAGWMAWHHPHWDDAWTAQAYMLAGLRVTHELDPDLSYGFEGFEPDVWELQRRVLATCHPAFHPDVAAAAEAVWQTPEDRRFHFEECGACLKRLVTSVRFWSKRGSRAYTAHITEFLRQTGWDQEKDVIHWVVTSRSRPRSG